MANIIEKLVFVFLTLSAGAFKTKHVESASDIYIDESVLLSLSARAVKSKQPPEGPWPEVCDQATLLTQAFSCFKADNISLFARHGLLLGIIREKSLLHFPSGIDVDFDVGYLPHGSETVSNYFKKSSDCFAQNQISVVEFWEQGGFQSCNAPPLDVQQQIMAGAPLTEELKTQLQSLCTGDTNMSGFVAKLHGIVNGREANITLSTIEFQSDGNYYFYDMPCLTYVNCAEELHHWYAEYGGQEMNPGEKIIKVKLPLEAFEPLTAVPFVLSRNKTSEMMVPSNSTSMLEGLYGPSWQQPWNKNNPDDQIMSDGPQEYLCQSKWLQ